MPGLEDRMIRILHEQEDATVVTNPKERLPTLLRKLAYRIQVLRDRLRRITARDDGGC